MGGSIIRPPHGCVAGLWNREICGPLATRIGKPWPATSWKNACTAAQEWNAWSVFDTLPLCTLCRSNAALEHYILIYWLQQPVYFQMLAVVSVSRMSSPRVFQRFAASSLILAHKDRFTVCVFSPILGSGNVILLVALLFYRGRKSAILAAPWIPPPLLRISL